MALPPQFPSILMPITQMKNVPLSKVVIILFSMDIVMAVYLIRALLMGKVSLRILML